MKKKVSFQEITNSQTPVLVDFFAEWCGPCKAMAPVLTEVAKEMGEEAKVIKVDVDKNQKLAEQLQIRGVPTLVIYKNGKIIWRESGMKSSHFLVGLLKQHSSAA